MDQQLRMAVADVSFGAIRGLFAYAERRVKKNCGWSSSKGGVGKRGPSIGQVETPRMSNTTKELLVTLTSFFHVFVHSYLLVLRLAS